MDNAATVKNYITDTYLILTVYKFKMKNLQLISSKSSSPVYLLNILFIAKPLTMIKSMSSMLELS